MSISLHCNATGNVYADIYESHLRGPSFVMEPPSRLDFSNSSGGWLDCSATGTPHPTIDWISMDSTSVGDVSSVRRVLRNGTLVLLPFSAAAYRQDIHNTIYRCVASNSVGRIISRDVQVRAGELHLIACNAQNAFYGCKWKVEQKQTFSSESNKLDGKMFAIQLFFWCSWVILCQFCFFRKNWFLFPFSDELFFNI